MIGRLLPGGYRVATPLPQDGPVELFLVEKVKLKRHEVLQVLPSPLASDTDFLPRFRKSARALNRLSHVCIPSLFDFGQLEDERFYLASEYNAGLFLGDIVAQLCPMSRRRAVQVLLQLTSALAEAHKRDIVHQRLNPRHILFTDSDGEEDHIKIWGMGVMAMLHPDTSPERAKQDDIRAVAHVGVELILGDPPEDNRLPPELQRAAPELMEILRACIHKPDSITMADVHSKLDEVYRTKLHAQSRMGLRPLPADMTQRENTDGAFRHSFSQESVSREFSHSASLMDLMSSDDARMELQDALLELAEAIADQELGNHSLTAAVAEVRSRDAYLAKVDTDTNGLRNREEKLVQSLREREGSLRFAIGELKFEAGRLGSESQKSSEPIQVLEEQLIDVLSEAKKEMARLDESKTRLAIEHTEAALMVLSAYAKLEKVVDELTPNFNSNLSLAPYVDRFQSIRDLLQEP